MKPVRQIIFVAWVALVLSVLSTPAAQLTINVGTTANDGTGDTLRTAGGKINTNFTALFNILGTENALILGGTNVVRFTNECFVSYGLATNNTLTVSNAGLAAVNGLYRTNNLNGLTQGIYKVCFDSAYGSFVISNATQKVYGLDDLGDTAIGSGLTWVDDFLGNPPAPKSWWGPITNCFTVLAASAGVPAPLISSNLYVNADIGNDTNALRGRIDRPWRNVQPALLASRPGDTVLLGPGSFPSVAIYGVDFYVSNNVTLVGAGRGVTKLGTPGAPEDFVQCGGTFVIRDMTVYGVPVVGGIAPRSTNALIDNCEIIGAADAIYIADFHTVFTVRNSDLFSMFDGIADWDGDTDGSNRVIRLINTTITCTNGAGGEPFHRRCIEGGDSRWEMFGGSLEARDGNGQNSCIRLDMAASGRTNKTGSVLLSNVRLKHSNTNGLSQVVSNFNNLPVFFDNCTEEPIEAALTSGSFTNQWWHRDVLIPNGSVRTNRLVDTRSLTNALVAASEQGHRITICDGGRTASGTNIIIIPSAGQTIIGQTWTNIVTDGGSLTLMIRGTNWVPVAKFP